MGAAPGCEGSESRSHRSSPVLPRGNGREKVEAHERDRHGEPSGNKSATKEVEGPEAKFKCNICLELPKDAIVTLCGHLYCWRCIVTWLNRGQNQCPVCKAGVTKSNVIPVYGTGEDTSREDTRSAHPASREGQEAAAKADAERRPTGERPQVSAAARSAGVRVAGGRLHFGLFPFLFTFDFNGQLVNDQQATQPLTREQQRHQLIVTVLILFTMFIIFWSMFIEPLMTMSNLN